MSLGTISVLFTGLSNIFKCMNEWSLSTESLHTELHCPETQG